jgi:hypothetical protein
MNQVRINLAEGTPLYQQVAAEIRRAIAEGEAKCERSPKTTARVHRKRQRVGSWSVCLVRLGARHRAALLW